LADRTIFLTLTPIGEEQRRSEAELWREFELARPTILGALLDAAAHGLRTVSTLELRRLPRMADFAVWATACETAMWPTGTFTRAYAANREAAIESISMQTRSPRSCESSCRAAASGQAVPPIFCGSALNRPVR